MKLIPISSTLILSACISFPNPNPNPNPTPPPSSMQIQSPAFQNTGIIPAKYTCDGLEISPPLTISDVPAEAKSLVLIVDDPDAPSGAYTHWTVWNIDPKTTEIPEGTVPAGAVQGRTSAGTQRYVGPCPPNGSHRYFFKVYALSKLVDLPARASKEELLAAIDSFTLSTAEFLGLYARSS